MDPHLPPVSHHDNILPEVKQSGIVKSRFVQRLKIDPNSIDDKTGSVAFMSLSEKRNPKALLNNAIIKLGIRHGKLVMSETKTRLADGTVKLQKIAVNVNSLANKLGVGGTAIREFSANQGQVNEVMTSVYKTTSSQQKAIHSFFTESPQGKAQASQIGAIFLHALDPAKNKSSGEFKIGEKQFVTYGNRIARAREENEVFDDRARTDQKLGAGSFGTAYKLESFCPRKIQIDSSSLVEKTSNVFLGNAKLTERAKKDLKMESDNLRYIADKLDEKLASAALREGLQKPAHGVNLGQNRGALVVDRYRDDLFNTVLSGAMTNSDRIKLVDNQVRALSFTQSIGLVHIDIKPENIFVDQNERGETIFRLADWGGARTAESLKTPPGNEEYLPATPFYTPFTERLIGGLHHGNIEALQRLSTFELGCTLYVSLTGFGPYISGYDQEGNEFQNTTTPFNREGLAGFPQPLINFIQLLCHPNPAFRPIGEDLAKQWNTLLDNFGGLSNLINSTVYTPPNPQNLSQDPTAPYSPQHQQGNSPDIALAPTAPYIPPPPDDVVLPENISSNNTKELFLQKIQNKLDQNPVLKRLVEESRKNNTLLDGFPTSAKAQYLLEDQFLRSGNLTYGIRWSESSNDYVLDLIKFDNDGKLKMVEVTLSSVISNNYLNVEQAAADLFMTGNLRQNYEEY